MGRMARYTHLFSQASAEAAQGTGLARFRAVYTGNVVKAMG